MGHPIITSHVKGDGGGRRSVTLCDKEGRDPKSCDITFQKYYYGDITRINQIVINI